MYRVILTLTLITLLSGTGFAQPFRFHADSLTYQLYMDKRWTPLLDETHHLLKRGIDFYYLRLRAGVAAYELKKYREAVTHLQQAYVAMPGDNLVNSYYFWALKYSGREDEASLLADRLSPGQQKEAKITKKGLINGVTAEALMSWNKNHHNLVDEGLGSQNGVSSYRSLVRNQKYYGVSLDHHLFPHINLYHNFSVMTISRNLQVNSRFNLPAVQHDPSTTQYQYFLNARYSLLKGWNFNASGSYLWGKSYIFTPVRRTSGKSDLEEDTWKIDDYVVNFGLSKETTFLSTRIDAGYGMINRYRQYQGTLGITIYPFRDNDFYINPEATVHRDGENGKTNLVFQPRIGVRTGPFWVTGEYGSGRMKNLYTNSGQIVYNIPESITSYWGAGIWAPILNYRMILSLRFRQLQKEGTTYIFASNFVSGQEVYKFNDQSLLITLKWNF